METTAYPGHKIAVVIPYYNASAHIGRVVSKLPSYIHTVIIIDDRSTEELPREELLLAVSPATQCLFLQNEENLGVGGATKKGFNFAIENGMDIVIKVDADDQMDIAFIPKMVDALVYGNAEVAKGNRFRDLKALKKMPVGRRMGNLCLSFLIKAATGYWNNFDPTNGFLAIKADLLRTIDFSKLSDRYYFETSLLSEFYFQKARVLDIPMPAIYGDEKSAMKIWKMPFVFGGRLAKAFLKRILKEYFLYDFNIASIYLVFGLPLFIFGIIFGATEWIYYASKDILAPTGTIMIITISIILGFQLLLQAIQYDIINAPRATR
ncbi:glycosyltransferase family 2 protein [Flavobacterium qiangtangense]|uniref:Glycosyltransferase family 2 protein n=1 Tax=Flavobacterium qiangtangense TaxID=1442595 RepID=A0ABW1PMF8_9FLAO